MLLTMEKSVAQCRTELSGQRGTMLDSLDGIDAALRRMRGVVLADPMVTETDAVLVLPAQLH